MTAILAAAVEAVGQGALRHMTELASLGWLALIGGPETVEQAKRLVSRLVAWLRPGRVSARDYWHEGG